MRQKTAQTKRPRAKKSRKSRNDSDGEFKEKKNTLIESFRFEKAKVPEEKLRNAIYNVLTDTTTHFQCYKDICSQLKDQNLPSPGPDCYLRTQYEARNCLLNQDWTNFSRLLFLLIQNEKKDIEYCTTTFKFFLIGLLHDPEVKDKDFLEAFLSSVFECNTPAEIKNFLREVSTVKKMEYLSHYKIKKPAEMQTTMILPEINMDKVNLEHSKNVRELFLGQKRKVPNLHKPNAVKRYTKK